MRRKIASFVACVGLLCSAGGQCADGSSVSGSMTPAEHVRTPDQTFLTFPEWYLVHSPAEYAAYLSRSGHPSSFPLYSHIGQFWQSYAAVNRDIEKYPFNGGYHLMVMVIGVRSSDSARRRAAHRASRRWDGSGPPRT